MSNTIYIGGRLESKEKGNVVTGANAILDDTKGKKQNVINKETDDELLRLEQSKQDNLNFDNSPTENSTNPVTSGGVYTAEKALSDAIEAILLLIPSAATELNKLVDTNTMNSSISTATATFRGTYNAVSDLGLTYQATHAQIEAALDALGLTADNNDFAFVQIPVSDQSQDIAKTERFKFNGTNWLFEYDLNTSGYTAAQWAAINSGITVALVTKLTDLPTAAALQLALNGKQDTLTFDNEPTALSQNPVTSGGIFTAIQAVAMALSDYSTTTDGRLNVLEGLVSTEASSSNKLTDKAYVDGLIQAITELIPAEADTTNQLADKAYVLAQILAATPAFKGQFTTLAELQAVASPKDGDLGIVRTKDSDGMDVFTVYQYLSNAWNVFYSLSYHPQTKPATTGTTGDYPYNGMGRVELAKNMVNTGTELAPMMVNQLTQDMFYKGAVGSRVPNTNTIFVIRYDYVMGENITIPDGCVLEFEGGSISGSYTLTGANTDIVSGNSKNIFTGIILNGTWESLNGENFFQVGENYIFKTIESAYLAIIANGGGIILIHSGIYDEAIIQPANSDTLNIHFVGESKETVVWKSTTFGYDYACFTGCGNLTFENIHFIKGTTPATTDQNIGYALHFDYEGRVGHVIVNNCIVESNENAAIGCGTRANQTIEITNCEIVSYTGLAYNDNGAFLYHTAGSADQTNQILILEGNVIRSNSLCAININNSAANNVDIHPRIINNILMTSEFAAHPTNQYWNEIVASSLVGQNSSIILDVDKCYGNSHNELNAIKSETIGTQCKCSPDVGFALTDSTNPPIKNGFLFIGPNSNENPESGNTLSGLVIGAENGRYYYYAYSTFTQKIYTKVVHNDVVVKNWSAESASSYIRTSDPLYYSVQGDIVFGNFIDLQGTSLSSYSINSSYAPKYQVNVPCVIKHLNGSIYDTFTTGVLIIKTDGTIDVKSADSLTSADYIDANFCYSMKQ